MTWSPGAMLEAFDRSDREWSSPDITATMTADWVLRRYPPRLVSPTFGAVQAWTRRRRPLAQFAAEAEAEAAAYRVDRIRWWVDDRCPPDDDGYLRRRGGVLCDDYLMMARPLDDPPAGSTAAGVEVRVVDDRRSFDAAMAVRVGGWATAAPTPTQADAFAEQAMEDLAGQREVRLLVTVDGHPAATATCRVSDGVARLFGAVTLPEHRRRGAYRAALDGRLAIARGWGATLAISRARTATSAPLLTRAGFAALGEERCYAVAL